MIGINPFFASDRRRFSCSMLLFSMEDFSLSLSENDLASLQKIKCFFFASFVGEETDCPRKAILISTYSWSKSSTTYPIFYINLCKFCSYYGFRCGQLVEGGAMDAFSIVMRRLRRHGRLKPAPILFMATIFAIASLH